MSPLNGVLSEAWDLYRRFAGHFLLIAFVIYLITAVLVALLSLGKIPGAIIGDIISFAATYVVQASLIKAVQDVRDGRVDLDLSETVRAAGPYILPVIGASVLAGIGIAIGFILLIVPGLILLTFWCLIIPFIVLAFGIVFGIVLGLLPVWVRSFVDSVVTGTLISPFLALVATLIYYRLTAAHAGQPYTPTGPAGAAVWEPPHRTEPPYPTVPPSAANSPGPPSADPPWPPAEPPASGPTAPGP